MQLGLDRLRHMRVLLAAGVVLAMCVLVNANPPVVRASNIRADAAVSTNAHGIRDASAFLHTVQVLSAYVHPNASGRLLILSAPHAVTDRLPAQYVDSLIASLAVANSKIAAGELAISADGSIYEVANHDVLLQDGYTAVYHNWWGTSYCISHHDITAYYQTGYFVGFALGFIAKISGWAGVLVSGLVGWFVAVDHGRGSCANLPWVPGPPAIWMTSQ